jgi:hypothetical protein
VGAAERKEVKRKEFKKEEEEVTRKEASASVVRVMEGYSIW